MSNDTQKDVSFDNIAVVIPYYKVTKHIEAVVEKIDKKIKYIYVIDDACPDKSGDYLLANCSDKRIRVLQHDTNCGVGAAVMTGYQQAIHDGAKIIVKIDGDGQMDPKLIDKFIFPIIHGAADYTKGNRFFNLEQISSMPKTRIFGNAILSFMTKLSSGYWNLFDPTNGFTAIHVDVARYLPFRKSGFFLKLLSYQTCDMKG